ncbi:putative oxidoreductase [Aquisphaera giovannonii]|uniref:Putative oxidoreductase n=1 Tax=Aquisphaera giovannonii TaxID=406548 RepID=A0A5B9W956_9BACT|nr:SDR family NAD(P)-dependent oxidoreductase [Aquisphaera giovannonii]QEH37063.1 putative oxidoreductase [Aquisphaera giovannonii]
MEENPPVNSPSRVAVITGASSGLGAAIARELATTGRVSAIALVARRRDRMEGLASELTASRRGRPVEVEIIEADLAFDGAPAEVAGRAIARFGGVDLLVNNAGLGLPTLFADAEPDQIRRQLAVNLGAPLLLTRHLLPSLVPRQGTIINIGSAITCVANSGLGAYGATKAALAYWNDALRRELGSLGVTVCLVEPGPIRTEFSAAFGRLTRPGDRPHPVVTTPQGWMMADEADVARRVVRLVDRPRRRLSVLRRMVWPFRVMGAAFRAFPALGDLAVSRGFHVDHSIKPLVYNGGDGKPAGDAAAP